MKNLTTLTIGKNVTEINITIHVDSEALELGHSIDEYNSTIKTIKGYKGTEAEKFARENRLNFEPLD